MTEDLRPLPRCFWCGDPAVYAIESETTPRYYCSADAQEFVHGPRERPMKHVDVDLFDDGLLWLINEVVFHKRGFSVGVRPSGEWVMLGDGSEPWQFSTGVGPERFAAVERLFARARAENVDEEPG